MGPPHGSIHGIYVGPRWGGQTQRTTPLSFPYAQVAGVAGIEMGASVCVYIGTRTFPAFIIVVGGGGLSSYIRGPSVVLFFLESYPTHPGCPPPLRALPYPRAGKPVFNRDM